MHPLVDQHETPLSEVPLRPAAAARWTDHVRPFQWAESDPPTATHVLSDGQETPLSGPSRPGVRSIDHLEPFHRSTSADDESGPVPRPPTATQRLGDRQTTLLSQLLREFDGFGGYSSVHRLPSHRSASVTGTARSSLNDPTAMHADGELHDTSVISPVGTAGAVTGCTCHTAAAAVPAPTSSSPHTTTVAIIPGLAAGRRSVPPAARPPVGARASLLGLPAIRISTPVR